MDRTLRPARRRRRPMLAVVQDGRGATAVEYGLILAVIVLTAFGAMAALGNQTSTMWNNVHAAVANAR